MLGELNLDQIEHMLNSQFIGRIGCHYNGETYIVPVTYAYDGEAVYAHSADGKKIEMMRQNHQVCFEVEHLENMGNWQTVIAHGTYEELHGEDAENGLKKLARKLSPVIVSESVPSGHQIMNTHPDVLDFTKLKAVAFKIVLYKKSGRYEKQF